MSKYHALWQYLSSQNCKEIKLTFQEISNIIRTEIDESLFDLKGELNTYGYTIKKLSKTNKYVIFEVIDNDRRVPVS